MPVPCLRGAVAALAAGLLPMLAATSSLADERREAVCAEAGERYRALFGRSPSDEPVTVVLMYGSAFCPEHVTVEKGSSLRWVNVEKRTSHSIWFKDAGRPESERIFPEESLDMTIDLPAGEHVYLCGPHWERQNMIGRVTVTER